MARHYRWEPKKDITPYELAIVAPHLHNLAMPWNQYFTEWVSKLPKNIKRHFKLIRKVRRISDADHG